MKPSTAARSGPDRSGEWPLKPVNGELAIRAAYNSEFRGRGVNRVGLALDRIARVTRILVLCCTASSSPIRIRRSFPQASKRLCLGVTTALPRALTCWMFFGPADARENGALDPRGAHEEDACKGVECAHE